MYKWDLAKYRRNRETHGVDFADVALFEWDTAFMQTDTDRTDPRTRALASLGEMTPEEAAVIEAGIAANPDTPELTDADFARMRPAEEVVPDIVATCCSAAVANLVMRRLI